MDELESVKFGHKKNELKKKLLLSANGLRRNEKNRSRQVADRAKTAAKWAN